MTSSTDTARRPGWVYGVVVAVVAAVVTTAFAALAKAAGIDLDVGDEPIPTLAFGQFVLVSGLIGLLLARYTSRRTFLEVTVTLAVLSCILPLALADNLDDKIAVALAHVVAAAIVIPALARQKD